MTERPEHGSLQIQVELPSPLRILARTGAVVTLSLDAAADSRPTQRSLVEALERDYPALRGTVRDAAKDERRAYIRFFADNEDVSHLGLQAALPESVVSGKSIFLIVGAVSGG